MADRLNRIVTRGGDGGFTSLGDGARVSKADSRVALLGEVDELNAFIGAAIAEGPAPQIAEALALTQHDLFDLGGALCFPGAAPLSAAHVARVDAAALRFNEGLPPLKEFILPGGSRALAALHVARTVCRRVERSAVAFFEGPDGEHVIAYLNRLSDFLFIAARVEARERGAQEILWSKARSVGG